MRRRIRRIRNNLICPKCGEKAYRVKSPRGYGYCSNCGYFPLFLCVKREEEEG